MEETYNFQSMSGDRCAAHTHLPVQMVFDGQKAEAKLSKMSWFKDIYNSAFGTSNVADPKLKSITYEDLVALDQLAHDSAMRSAASNRNARRNFINPPLIDWQEYKQSYLSDFDDKEYPAEFSRAPTESENIAALADEMRDNPAFGIM